MLALENIWNEIDSKLRKHIVFPQELKITQKWFYNNFKTLIQKTEWDITEWDRAAGLEILNNHPFHNITMMVGEKIIVDKEKLTKLSPSYMYSWFYEIAESCKAEL